VRRSGESALPNLILSPQTPYLAHQTTRRKGFSAACADGEADAAHRELLKTVDQLTESVFDSLHRSFAN